MFDIGFYEILLILIVAFFVLDAKDLPKLLYKIGKGIRHLRTQYSGIKTKGQEIFQEMEIEDFKTTTFEAVKKRDAEAKKNAPPKN